MSDITPKQSRTLGYLLADMGRVIGSVVERDPGSESRQYLTNKLTYLYCRCLSILHDGTDPGEHPHFAVVHQLILDSMIAGQSLALVRAILKTADSLDHPQPTFEPLDADSIHEAMDGRR